MSVVCLKRSIVSYIVCANSKVSIDNTRMHRFAWTIPIHIGDNIPIHIGDKYTYPFYMGRLVCDYKRFCETLNVLSVPLNIYQLLYFRIKDVPFSSGYNFSYSSIWWRDMQERHRLSDRSEYYACLRYWGRWQGEVLVWQYKQLVSGDLRSWWWRQKVHSQIHMRSKYRPSPHFCSRWKRTSNILFFHRIKICLCKFSANTASELYSTWPVFLPIWRRTGSSWPNGTRKAWDAFDFRRKGRCFLLFIQSVFLILWGNVSGSCGLSAWKHNWIHRHRCCLSSESYLWWQ